MRDKKELLKKIEAAKKIFDEVLLDKSYIYIFHDKDKKIKYFEMKCAKNNFLHLTGVETDITASKFYSALESRKLSLKDINYKSNGTTELKLSIFNRLSILFTSPVQICIQDNFFTLRLEVDVFVHRPIHTEKDIILGLKKDKKNNFFAPASLLKEKPQKIGKEFCRVLGILEKNQKDESDYNIKYKAKDIDIEKILKDLNF